MTREVILNVATAIATLAAVVVAAVRVKEVIRENGRPLPVSVVREWQRFAAVGDRKGPDNPELTLVEFGDFTCSVCRRAIPYLKDVRRRIPTLAFVYRHFPVTPAGKPAAVAAICAEYLGKFEPMHDLLYSQPESLGVKPWTRFASEAGIGDTLAFVECLHGSAVNERLRADSLAAVELDVSGTPTFLLNHVKITGFHGAAKMDSIIQTLRVPARAP